MSEHSVPRASQ